MTDLAYVTITETWDDGSGTPLAGQVIFTPSQTAYAAGVPVVSADNPVTAQILGGVLQNVHLLATDNSGLAYFTPTGFFYWTAAATVGGVPQPGFSFFLPSSPGTVDLYSLANTAAGGGGGDVSSVFGRTGTVAAQSGDYAAAQVGAVATSEVGAASGVASLGSNSIVPAAQMGAVPAEPSAYSPLLYGGVWGYPWKVWVDSRGAKGNAVIVSDAVMSNGSAALACTDTDPFTSTDIDAGKTVAVMNAGAAGVPLVTTIASVSDPAHATLSAPAQGAVAGVGCTFGTNDTAAIQAAINAAVTYGSAHGGEAEVVLPPLYYMASSAATAGGSTAGNAQITLPVITAGTAPKVLLTLNGLGVASPGPHWLQTNPSPCGATIISTGQGTLDGTNGPGCVIGGPYAGYGGGGGTFSNMCVVADGLTISPVYYANGFGQITGGGAQGPGFGGLNLWGVGQAIIKSYSFIPLGVADASSAAWPFFSPAEDWGGTQWQPGLIMPVTGNNDLADAWQYSCYGAWSAAVVSEHFNAQAVRALNCGRGLQIQGGGGGGTASHGVEVLYMSSEETGIPVSAETGGYYRVTGPIGVRIETLDLESYDSNTVVFDQGDSDTTIGYLSGEIHFNDLSAPGYRSGGLISAPHGTSIKLVQLNLSPGVASPPALTNGTAVANYFYRDASVRVSGSVSSVAVDGTQIGTSSGGGYLVPAGHTITVTGGGIPTWNWVLL